MRFWSLLLALPISAIAAPPRPARVYDLIDVTYRIRYDESKGTIAGTVINTLTPLKPGTKAIFFDCGPLDLDSVAVNGKATAFRRDGEQIWLDLAQPAGPADLLRVTIAYHGRPTAGVYFVKAAWAYPSKTGMVYTQGEMEDTRYWIPTYDYPDDKATLESFIEVPKGQFALSNGKLIGVEKLPDRDVFHWKIDQRQSTYLLSWVAGPYVEVKQSQNPPVSFVVPPGLEEQGRVAFGKTPQMVALYGKLTGFPYPYAKFSQCTVADYMFGGMENTTCVTQTITTLHPASTEPNVNSEGLVAHELAHQWFGDTLTCKSWPHIWLNEGFATFLPFFWTREAHGQDEFDISREQLLEGALAATRGVSRPVVNTEYELPIDIFDGQSYGGGAARMMMLMHLIGEDVFWKGVKTYLEKFKFDNVDTEGFFAVMSQVSGKDLSGFMKQWFYGKAAPRFTVTREGKNIKIVQSEPIADVETELAVYGSGGMQRVPVRINAKTTVVDGSGLPSGPAILDPDCWVMCDVEYPQGFAKEDFAQIWQNAGQRMRLLPLLRSKLTPEEYTAWAVREAKPSVQRAMIGWLPNSARSEILEFAKSSDPLVADQGLNKAAQIANELGVADLLKTTYRNSKNDVLRQAALEGLLNLPDAADWADDAWGQASWRDGLRSRILSWWSGKDPARARRVALTIVGGGFSEPLRATAISVLGRLKDEPGSRSVFDALCRIAREPSCNGRRGAFQALAAYGDKAAIPFIEPSTKDSLHFMRRDAEATIRALGGK